MFNVIGLSAYYHDSAACLLQDGALVAAAQEERFSRRKHDESLPLQAFTWCLRHAGLTIADVDCVAYYELPYQKLERQLEQRASTLQLPEGMRLWRRAHLPADAIRDSLGYAGEVECFPHHHSHAASAFLFSGFPEAAILTVDGVGEAATTTFGHGAGSMIDVREEVTFPHSLGLLYSTITAYLGFSVNDGEYKVMGLAPYGTPRYADRILQLVHVEAAGQYRLDLTYFDFTRADSMYAEALFTLLGHPPRRPGDPILAFHQDVARSLQVVLEEILLEKVRYLHDCVPVENLCMAGGVALNCVANGRILRDGPFERLFVQPAAGDAGGAVGAAALAHLRRGGAWPTRQMDALLGPSFSVDHVIDVLARVGLRDAGIDYRGDEAALLEATVDRLAQGKVVGWFHGRMEFGPRALGARSIIADPRDPGMRDRINGLIKERESFRPFAPVVLDAHAAEHFDLDHPSPFMLETCQVISPLALPAVTHVDGSARVQTINPCTQPRFAALLERFHARTGCPILLNTSFNLRDEPIVAGPQDALLSFLRSRLDTLVLEDVVIDRDQLSPALPARARRHQPMSGARHVGAYTF